MPPIAIPPPDPDRHGPIYPPTLDHAPVVAPKPFARHLRDFLLALALFVLAVGAFSYCVLHPAIGQAVVTVVLVGCIVAGIGLFLWRVTA